MNKLAMLMVLPHLLGTLFNFNVHNAPPSSSTPDIPGNRRKFRTRVHAPADGRWHMKYHRGRV